MKGVMNGENTTGKITDDVWSLDYKQIGQNVTNTIQQLDAKY